MGRMITGESRNDVKQQIRFTSKLWLYIFFQ
jgi:hypothetical protein